MQIFRTKKHSKRIASFLFEGSMLKRTLRTGYAFLGQGKETVAAHTYGVSMIAMVIARESQNVDMEKILKMCLFHDLPEARTGDINLVQKRYISCDEAMAVEDMVKDLSFGEEIKEIIAEYREGKTREAVIVHDADQLDMLLSLKEQMDLGSKDAKIWIPYVVKRLKTEHAKAIAEAILKEHWANWWMNEFTKRQKS